MSGENDLLYGILKMTSSQETRMKVKINPKLFYRVQSNSVCGVPRGSGEKDETMGSSNRLEQNDSCQTWEKMEPQTALVAVVLLSQHM